jgi:hypothetical protein
MLLDISLRGTDDTVQRLAAGRLGAFSFETYCSMPRGKSIRPLDRAVRFEDLNMTGFEKTLRIKPGSPERRYSRGKAIISAKR